jgi:signal transduction histidine kinase
MASIADRPRELSVISEKSGLDSIIVAVRDSGNGIECQKVDQMFNAFFTTKPTGLGMGLSISRSIIEAHGGRIWAALNKDQGLTVQFSLPAENEDSWRESLHRTCPAPARRSSPGGVVDSPQAE